MVDEVHPASERTLVVDLPPARSSDRQRQNPHRRHSHGDHREDRQPPSSSSSRRDEFYESERPRCQYYYEELLWGVNPDGSHIEAIGNCPYCLLLRYEVKVFCHPRQPIPSNPTMGYLMPHPTAAAQPLTPSRAMPRDSAGAFMSPGPIQGSSSQIDISMLRKSWLSSFDKYGLDKWPTTKYSAEDWVASLEDFAERYITGPNDRFEAFSIGTSTTSATARAWLNTIIPPGSRPSFAACKEAFLDRYGDRNRIQQLEREFFQLNAPASGREGVETHTYLDKLTNLISQLGYDQDPANFLLTFIFRRLSPATKEMILRDRQQRSAGEKTPSHGYEDRNAFFTAISQASATVASLGSTTPSREKKPTSTATASSSSSSSSFTPCPSHPLGKHEWKDCSTNPANLAKKTKLNMKRKAPASNSALAHRPAGSSGPKPAITCYTCGQAGHMSATCPYKDKFQPVGKK